MCGVELQAAWNSNFRKGWIGEPLQKILLGMGEGCVPSLIPQGSAPFSR